MMRRGAWAATLRLNDEAFLLPADVPTEALPVVRPSCEELVQVLLHDGATLLARQEHGVLLRARHRLIFVRRKSVVDDAELLDALRAAGIPVGRFVELIQERRRRPLRP
jgi:hypothetical protein